MNFLLNDKGLSNNHAHVRLSFVLSFLFFFISIASYGQVERPVRRPVGDLTPVVQPAQAPADTVRAPSDSLTVKADTIPAKGDIETTINYTARDSIRADMNSRKVWLYGSAKITYGEIELEAEEIVIDYAENTLTAHGLRDSLGHRIGYPIFKNGAELYETKDIIYNFKTKRARISEVVTKQGEGILSGDIVYKNEKNELLSLHNGYTTCNLEHPHFVIRATKTKAIPNDKIVAGPFYMEFNDIPLPIGFLFGMFPAQRESSSGIIFPSYGEERRRGFNLRGGGYFFDISEYVKLALTGDIYSKGGHAIYANSNYLKRYAYSGSVNFSYSHNRTMDKIENPQVANDFRLTWSHSPQTKGTTRFAASVNAATSTFNSNNLINNGALTQSAGGLSNLRTQLSSNVSISKRFSGTPFTMGLNFNHNQNLVTKQVDLLLPSMSLNMTNVYPFQRKGKTGALDNLSVSYTMGGINKITNNLGRFGNSTTDSIAPFTGANLSKFFENSKKGIRHSLPVSYSFKVLRFFTMSPSVSYEEKWYFEKLDWRWQQEKNGSYTTVADTVKGFNRISNYNFSTGLTTRLYGTHFFKKGKIKAIRHIVNPSISFNVQPDFTQNTDYFTRLVRPAGPSSIYAPQVTYKSRHDGFVYGGSAVGGTGSIGFGIGNNLEMKIKGAKDTVERKVMLLNNFSINSSYNLIADSFKLAPISLAANTNILDGVLNINLSASIDPYSYVKTFSTNAETGAVTSRERRFDTYAWKGGKIGRLTSATMAVSSNLNPKARESQKTSQEKIAQSDLPDQEKQYYLNDPNSYVDFDIPWNLNINYTLSYGHRLNTNPTVTQTITASGKVNISKAWEINFNTGYHFENKEFTQTNLGIGRDLHCWTMRLNWVPFGRFQSYNFTINVKSSMLQDLKLERRKPFLDNL